MSDNEDQQEPAESPSEEPAKTSVRRKLSPLATAFLIIIVAVGIPLIWFVNDDDFRCQLCRDTKGQTCIGVLRAVCAGLEMYPYPKNPR